MSAARAILDSPTPSPRAAGSFFVSGVGDIFGLIPLWRNIKPGDRRNRIASMVERQFRVVTHKRWLAELFRPMGAVIDHGFDIDPTTALDTIWWAPGAWVASAHLSGVQLPLLSCGPDWLASVPREYRGRDVQNVTINEIPPGKTEPKARPLHLTAA